MLAITIEPEILTFLGIVVTGLLSVIAYAIVRTTRSTSLEVDMADILKQYQKALEQLGDCNEIKATLLGLQKENSELTSRMLAIEAEADRIERVRTENTTLKGMITKLRNRVKNLEDYLRQHGLEIPNGYDETNR